MPFEGKLDTSEQNETSRFREVADVCHLIKAYREHGHKAAMLDPLKLNMPGPVPELDPSRYGLSAEMTERFDVTGLLHTETTSSTLTDIIQQLKAIYCGPIAVEFQHLSTAEEREWFARRYEESSREYLPSSKKIAIANLMLRTEAFDHFLAKKFPTVKRYGCEGSESMMAFLYEVFSSSPKVGVEDIVMCMPHRGRNNVLTCMLNYPPVVMFQKMKGKREFPDDVKGTGDVLSHLSISTDLVYDGATVHVSLIPNPSHLEANNPVCVGKARSRKRRLKDGDYSGAVIGQDEKVMCLQIHGDGSVAAQGIVAETFSMAYAPHFRVGGSIHLTVNNQLAFTTEGERGRSSRYCSDIAKMINCPVIHVNGDNPEEVVRAARLAVEYREAFKKDVFVDLLCVRKWGHNEIDDATFTQPVMYDVISKKSNIPDQYAEFLKNEGVCTMEDLNEDLEDWNRELAQQMTLLDSHIPKPDHLEKQWSGLIQAPNQITKWDTGVNVDILKYVGEKSVSAPEDFNVHPTILKTHVERRRAGLVAGSGLDWSTAEALAFGSLLYQGFHVRISGQDVGRGTFSHRHVMLVDQKNDEIYIPLNHLVENQKAFLEVANSVLSEEAVLGFEYGMSMDDPNALVIWEAQFGDFFNGAQIIIDTYVTSAESKWLRQSGLVILLPHGMDGAGPEHSSCRMERFLQMCDSKEDGFDGDDVNYHFANPTTSAQYFHLLRRQMVRKWRKPLVVASPKMILRLPRASSSLTEMAEGTSFHSVIGDGSVKPDKVTKVIMCCGKHFYELKNQRDARKLEDVALIRIEELCPFPAEDIRHILHKFKNAKEFIWAQEEHRNMGAWSFVKPRFENVVGVKLRYAGREVHPTPAVGVVSRHQLEADSIINETFS